MRFAGRVHNFFDRGVDFGSRHAQTMENQTEEQMKAWGLEGMVHNAGIEADTRVQVAKYDSMGQEPHWGNAVGGALQSNSVGGLAKAMFEKWG